jgi:hypothetical protein
LNRQSATREIRAVFELPDKNGEQQKKFCLEEM